MVLVFTGFYIQIVGADGYFNLWGTCNWWVLILPKIRYMHIFHVCITHTVNGCAGLILYVLHASTVRCET